MLQAIYNKSRLAAVMRGHLARLPGGSPGSALLISLTGKVKLAAPLRKNNDVVLVLGTIGPFPKPLPFPPITPQPFPFTSLASFTCCSEADSPPSVILPPFPMA